MAQESRPRTVVEFLDAPGADRVHKTFSIRINGSEVEVAKDGARIEMTDKGLTLVHLTLMPSEVHFTS